MYLEQEREALRKSIEELIYKPYWRSPERTEDVKSSEGESEDSSVPLPSSEYTPSESDTMPSPSQSRSSAVRRLFYEDDQASLPAGHADNVANIVLESKKEEFRKAKERWNFDFESETPLQGRWEWTSVSSSQTYRPVRESSEVDESAVVRKESESLHVPEASRSSKEPAETSTSAKESSEGDAPAVVRKESESLHAPEDSTSSKEPSGASRGSEASKKSSTTEALGCEVSRLSEPSSKENVDDPSLLAQRHIEYPFCIPGFFTGYASREGTQSVTAEPRLSDDSSSPIRELDCENKPTYQMVLLLPPIYLEKAKSIYKTSLKEGFSKRHSNLFTKEYLQLILSRLMEKSKGLEEGSIQLYVDLSDHTKCKLLPSSSSSTTSSKQSDNSSSSQEKTTKKEPVKDQMQRFRLLPLFFENLIETFRSLPGPISPPSTGTDDSEQTTDVPKELTDGLLKSLLTARQQQIAEKKSSLTSTDIPSTSKKADKSSDESTSVEDVSESTSSDESKEREREFIPGPGEMAESLIVEPGSLEASEVSSESGTCRRGSSNQADKSKQTERE